MSQSGKYPLTLESNFNDQVIGIDKLISPLIYDSLSVLRSELVSKNAGSTNTSIMFGTGLVSKGQLSEGVPIDFLAYILSAERVRRHFGLNKICHLIADEHAKQVCPGQTDQIMVLAKSMKALGQHIAGTLGFSDKYEVILASDMRDDTNFQQCYDATKSILENIYPAQSIGYLRNQLADMEYMRLHKGATVKLSWAMKGDKSSGSGGFDEKFFDDAHDRHFGGVYSYIYTRAGRTFDPSRPRSSPYVALNSSYRAMLWPQSNEVEKIRQLMEQQGGQSSYDTLQYYKEIIAEHEDLFGLLEGKSTFEKVEGLLSKFAVPELKEIKLNKIVESGMNDNISEVGENEVVYDIGCNVETIIPPNGLKEKLSEASATGRQLVVKLGFDPTAPDLHLGHAVVLRKLRDFQQAGHKIVVIIGDFTARIGDPTGRNSARPPLSEEGIRANSETYINQLSKVLDTSRIDVKYNSDWLGKMNFADVVKLTSRLTLAQMMQREDFGNRYKAGTPIHMHELLYPLMQGHDSVAINADIEIGGTDQLFNCQVGRALQEVTGNKAQIVLSMPLLVGLDGIEKMSKSKGNYIGLTEEPNQMYGKAMSIPDGLLLNYLDLVTDFSAKKINELKIDLASGAAHPMEIKKAIAENIVHQYHGAQQAQDASLFFFNQFQNKDRDTKVYKPLSLTGIFGDKSSMTVLDICHAIKPEISKSEARRLIQANAVEVNDNKVSEPASIISRDKDLDIRIRIGKKGYYVLKCDI